MSLGTPMKLLALASLLLTLSFTTSAQEAGMIEFDVPPGPLAGKAHWYALRTMKGLEYWEKPAVLSDITENEDGTYSVSGEPPISIALVLHPLWGDSKDPWRVALDWIRQAEQLFRNSGVPLRFVVEHIETNEDFPDSKKSAHDWLVGERTRLVNTHGVDMVVGLAYHFFGDPLCGVATMGRYDIYYPGIVSVSGCDVKTLAHEMGHNFGLNHDFKTEERGNTGYCILGESGSSETCSKGTIMAYSQTRVPFFSSTAHTYKKDLLGIEGKDAVAYLNKVKTGRALSYELRAEYDSYLIQPDEIVSCEAVITD